MKRLDRNALRARFAQTPDLELVTHCRCHHVQIALGDAGRINRFATIERLIDVLAPLPEATP